MGLAKVSFDNEIISSALESAIFTFPFYLLGVWNVRVDREENGFPPFFWKR